MRRCHLLAIMVLFATLGAAQNLSFVTNSLPTAMLDKPYQTRIQASGGTTPLHFGTRTGSLPPGLKLLSGGLVQGVPTKAGVYTFRVTVTDSTGQSASKQYTIEVSDSLLVQWKRPPSLDSNTISGSLQVSNGTADTFNLTVIVVAVNEVGKAFALGYQHFNLASSGEQAIPFTSTVPNGRYIVHADAIAEVPSKHRIHRVHLQTDRALVVNVNR